MQRGEHHSFNFKIVQTTTVTTRKTYSFFNEKVKSERKGEREREGERVGTDRIRKDNKKHKQKSLLLCMIFYM